MHAKALVPIENHTTNVQEADFAQVEHQDVTESWASFVAQRLADFRNQRAPQEACHGADGFAALEGFYAAVPGYFETGVLARVRVKAR